MYITKISFIYASVVCAASLVFFGLIFYLEQPEKEIRMLQMSAGRTRTLQQEIKEVYDLEVSIEPMEQNVVLEVRITDIDNQGMMVIPISEEEARRANQGSWIEVLYEKEIDYSKFEIGEVITIVYDGRIMESSPGRLEAFEIIKK